MYNAKWIKRKYVTPRWDDHLNWIIRYLTYSIKYVDEKDDLIEIDYIDSSHSQKGKWKNSKENTSVVRLNTQHDNVDESSKKKFKGKIKTNQKLRELEIQRYKRKMTAFGNNQSYNNRYWLSLYHYKL